MNTVALILKKKAGQALTKEEIDYLISGYSQQLIPDYQMSALLMAICFNGMDDKEISDLTMAMVNSGHVIDLSAIKGIKVDKHSTGGVGDKTSLVLGPMVASCGAKVAKMSGRGLGHTGGTLDKLESFTNFSFDLSEEQFFEQVNDIGLAIAGQNANLVVADKKLYALRDVTGTVNSIPLISSSIMSKKIASGSNAILLDVKYGQGAFMTTIEDAKKLATTMVKIGKNLNRDTRAIISDMNQPLGNAIGNALEVKEAIDTLKGKGPSDLLDLCLIAGSIMLQQANICSDLETGKALLKENIDNGKAFEVFKKFIVAQGGSEIEVDNYDLLPKAKYISSLKSLESGYIKHTDALKFGILSMELGAGRKTKEDPIDHAVGLILKKKVGDYVNKGDILVEIHANKELEESFYQDLRQAFEFSNEKVIKSAIVEEIIQ